MSAFRKIKAMVLGQNLDMDVTTTTLQQADIPVSTDSCRACTDPCDLGTFSALISCR